MKNWIVNNFWIKIIALVLAVLTWFYVNGELEKEKRLSKEFYKKQFMEHLKSSPPETKPMNKGYIIKK